MLKGLIDTIVYAGRVRFNRTGAPGMTTGGTGDLLARMPAMDADAGDGLLATDLLNHLVGTHILYNKR